jgi:hypothetical protein
MLTTLTLLASLLSQPAPQPAPAGSPAITIQAPSWSFAPMSIPDTYEPEWVGAAFADFVEAERADAIMASVTPFETDDASDPFEGGGR